MSSWIDFKELRQKLNFEQVLQLYGVEIKRKGEQHHGFCPLPNHEGKRRSPSFSANLARGIFQCFGCGAKGNALEFAALMERVDPKDGQKLRTVAIKLRDKCCPELGKPSSAKESEGEKPSSPAPAVALPVVVNAPLDFELKGLDQQHPYLRSRGLSPDTVAHFGLGVASRGSLKGRLAIPLKDHNAALVGYGGRLVDDSLISEENPRYRLPSKRERDGKIFEFHKTLFLYNGYRFKEPLHNLVVVEGFPSVWWLTQCGQSSVVATMGADCSERQAELIVSLVKPEGRVWFVPDGDDAGVRFADSVLRQVSPHRFVRWVKLAPGTQPTDLTAQEVKARLNF